MSMEERHEAERRANTLRNAQIAAAAKAERARMRAAQPPIIKAAQRVIELAFYSVVLGVVSLASVWIWKAVVGVVRTVS